MCPTAPIISCLPRQPMPKATPTRSIAFAFLLFGCALPARAQDSAYFEKQVQPILKQHCFKCHGDGKLRGGLRLTSRESLLKGGDSGPAVTLDKPELSRLLHAINYKNGLEMLPDGKLPQEKIDVLTRWVKAGVPWTPGATKAAD